METRSFHPSRRILMGAGPSDVPARVRQAMAHPTLGHLDPEFGEFMDGVKELLRYAFRTRNELTFPFSGPGSAGMEACIVNLVEPGDEVVVCRNGYFSNRMHLMVERAGGVPVMVEAPWGRAIDPAQVEAALAAHPKAKVVTFVHAETSTGVLSDAAELAGIARRHDAYTIVDAVTSLVGTPVLTDEWGLDAVFAAGQKCLSAPPGLSPITMSPRAVDRIKNRRIPVHSWFMDMGLLTSYWSGAGRRAYHHTAPSNALYGLHEALVMLTEEGLEPCWTRHRLHHEALKAGLTAMGLELLVDEPIRTPQLNPVKVPAGVDEAEVRTRLRVEHGLEIGAGLGDFAGKVWRIGLMGAAASRVNVLTCLSALDTVLGGVGAPYRPGVGAAAAREIYAASS